MSEEKEIDKWKLNGFLIPITECKYFEGIGDCKETKCLCIDNKNCYFKQLKRLQQENEELKAEIDRQKETIIYLKNYDMCHKTLIQYEKALEEIREMFFGISKTMPNMNKTASGIICDMLDEYNKLHIDILTKINEVLK